MNNLAIIPARGGSKRIPRKNINNFIGTPIIAYSIKAAIDSKLFDEVMVSTDDLEIAEIAKKYGARIPFLRSQKNSNDFSTTIDVIEEVVEEYKSINQNFKNICCIYPCAPLINVQHLIESYSKLENHNFDTVFPLIKYSTPIQRAFKITDNKVSIINQDFANTRSQDLEASYYDAGQFYWLQTLKFITKKQIFSDNSGFIILDEYHAQDIDTKSDWELAELKYKLINKL